MYDSMLPSALESDSLIGFMTVMAAELVRAARSESKGEPERLRLSFSLLPLHVDVFLGCRPLFIICCSS